MGCECAIFATSRFGYSSKLRSIRVWFFSGREFCGCERLGHVPVEPWLDSYRECDTNPPFSLFSFRMAEGHTKRGEREGACGHGSHSVMHPSGRARRRANGAETAKESSVAELTVADAIALRLMLDFRNVIKATSPYAAIYVTDRMRSFISLTAV
jgi:hypothetical protein